MENPGVQEVGGGRHLCCVARMIKKQGGLGKQPGERNLVIGITLWQRLIVWQQIKAGRKIELSRTIIRADRSDSTLGRDERTTHTRTAQI